MKKTLGGDRLGAGNKMTVEMKNYERSTHNLSYLWRSTMSAGTLVPFLNQVGLPGDTFDIKLDCNIMTHPTLGPLFGSFKVQLDVFMCPIRLYNAALHNNKLGIGMNMAQVKLPYMKLTRPVLTSTTPPDIDNCQINPSCLLAYLGIRGIGQPKDGTTGRTFNALPLLSYYDIYKNYYSNKQEEIGFIVHTPAVAIPNLVVTLKNGTTTIPQNSGTTAIPVSGTDLLALDYNPTPQPPETIILGLSNGQELPLGSIMVQVADTGGIQYFQWNSEWMVGAPWNIFYWKYTTVQTLPQTPVTLHQFNLSEIDDMREAILQASVSTPFDIMTPNLEPYKSLLEEASDVKSALYTQEGLAIKTYQSDLLNNWLQTDWIDGTNGITAITAIDTTTGKFTLDTLNLAKKVYDMLNRIAVSGGTYDDWLDAVYTHDRITRAETPIYMGGLIKELVFQQIVSLSNAQAGQGTTQPLGTLAGKGTMHEKHKGGTIVIKVDEPSYIIGIVSLTPRIDYSQGNTWDVNLQTMDDLHKPALDEIGFQELTTELAAWWDSKQESDGSWVMLSAGKQPAWINYMTNINKVYGNFAIADNEMFMTLNRRYEAIWDSGLSKYLIKDLTTYIDPVKYNQIFAQTSLDSQNFWTQIGVNIEARRKMSAKLMPNL